MNSLDGCAVVLVLPAMAASPGMGGGRRRRLLRLERDFHHPLLLDEPKRTGRNDLSALPRRARRLLPARADGSPYERRTHYFPTKLSPGYGGCDRRVPMDGEFVDYYPGRSTRPYSTPGSGVEEQYYVAPPLPADRATLAAQSAAADGHGAVRFAAFLGLPARWLPPPPRSHLHRRKWATGLTRQSIPCAGVKLIGSAAAALGWCGLAIADRGWCLIRPLGRRIARLAVRRAGWR